MSETLRLTLRDGVSHAIEVGQVAATLAREYMPRAAQDMVAVSIDGQIKDASYVVDQSCQLDVITASSEQGLEIIRHSCAHLLAQAVKQLYPSAQVTIGPVIEDGFYYDFYYPPGFNEEALAAIEAKMKALVKEKLVIKRHESPRNDVIAQFQGMGEDFKVKIIEALPHDEVISVYAQGDFQDLCRGPHVRHTGQLKAFKLTKVSGAYWQGDQSQPMLQRIYGTAWATREDLKAYLTRIEEAKKRDHRLLGQQMNLFHLQEEAPGMPFFHPNGWTLYQLIQQYLRDKYRTFGYQEIHTPQLVNRSLWEKSGHWDKFSDEIFIVEGRNDDAVSAIKPMNCPCHVQVFKQGLKSHHQLPLRLAEFGCCHRDEPSGALHGLMRVRSFVQDDGHIFCEESSIEAEILAFIQQTQSVYQDFGFTDLQLNLSTRPAQRVGDDETWDHAEQALERALNATGLPWICLPGEGAFYGPKIDFSLKDCLGRLWQCGTVQLDFSMPKRLGASYVASDGSKQVPVMLHRAMLGSIERFMAILLEETAGKLPLWLAPVQLVVMNVSLDTASYAESVVAHLQKGGWRVETDLRQEKIGYKIREHTLKRVPLLVICGSREQASAEVSIRTQAGEQLSGLSFDQLTAYLQAHCTKGEQLSVKN